MLFKFIIALVAFYTAAVTAHISLAQPVPYGKPDTSPLSPSGSNYPCKTENGFKVNSVTKMAVGESQKLAFSGTAVHGGGSCQLSLTSGFTPTGSSQFKVIYSIEGGCPGTDGSTAAYDFKIPAEVPAGDYTLAWTWFNRIGNREMYMNCAPITVTGGSGSQSSYSALPDMAIFNIQSKNSCGTTEGTDVAFPIPGQYVMKGAGNKPGAPTNCGSASAAPAAAAGSGSGSGTGSGSSAGSGSAAPASGTTGDGSGSGTGSANNGQYTGIGASSAKPSVAVVAPQAAAPSAAAPASKPSSTSPSSGGSAGTFAEGSNGGQAAGNSSSPASAPAASAPSPASGSSSAAASGVAIVPVTPAAPTAGGSCSTDGSVVCSADGAQFGLCNWGKVVMMDVAAGTKCVGGQIMRKRAFLA